MIRNEYKASLSKFVCYISGGMLLLFALIVFLVLTSADNIPPAEEPLLAGALALLVITPVIAFLCSPTAYLLTEDRLIIKRRIRPRTMPYHKIASIQMVEGQAIETELSHIRANIFFGFLGKLRVADLGEVSVFATSRRNPILVTTHKQKKYLLTPDNPEMFYSFVAALNEYQLKNVRREEQETSSFSFF